tara:strand:+ start:5548 stop:6981 length:1434 start_codon:yes stop_codon:yes gene_type:complete
MIGKIMSEAAHSIIGMFSARPVDMENNPSNSDFGSLLRSPEEQPHSSAAGVEIDTSDSENVDVGDIDAVPAQHWETTNVLPFINHSFGSTIFNQDRSSGNIEQDQTITDAVDFDRPESKLSLTFNRDTLQNIRSTAFAADGEAHQATARLAADILTPQANVILSNGSQIEMAPTPEEADIVDGQPVDDKLLKMKGSPQQMLGEAGELLAQAAKPSKSNQSGHLDARFNDPTSQLKAGEQAAALSPLVTKSGEQKDARSELGQFGFRSSPRDILPVATSSPQKPTIADGEFVEPAKSDAQSVIKNFETSMEQLPLANSSAQLAVRETIQKPASFDMSSPQIAQRLGAEIADISVSGGTKKFEINPRNLGRMEIIFTTRGSAEIIEIQTEHRAAKDIIVQHSQVLQDILKSQGRDDLTLRVDVKENMFSSSRSDGGNLSQQENGGAREQQARPSQNRQMAQSFDSTAENDPASDNSRYA